MRVLVLLEKVPPALIAAKSHSFNFARLEGIHGDAANEGDVDAEPSVHTGAREADKNAKLGRRPLRRGRVAIAANVVLGLLLERGQLRQAS